MARSSHEEAAADPPRPAWVYDAITENAPLGTTGGLVWDAARRLARFIEREGCLASGAAALPPTRAPLPAEAAASGSVEQPQPPGAAQGREQSQPPGTALGQEQLQPPGTANERQQPVTSVLELGAGCGWLGLTLVRNLPSVHVTVTEQEAGGGLAWLRHNVQLNRSLDPSGAARIACRACDWNDFLGGEAGRADGEAAPTQRRPSGGDGPQPSGPGCDGGPNHEHVPDGNVPVTPSSSAPTFTAPCRPALNAASPAEPAPVADPPIGRICSSTGRPWDWLLGSDLIYTEGGCRALPRVIRSLATPGHTRILYCHTKHRFDNLDLMLMEELASCGLSCQEVREQGEPSPPPSPPPLTELFPDMRIAVYRLSFL